MTRLKRSARVTLWGSGELLLVVADRRNKCLHSVRRHWRGQWGNMENMLAAHGKEKGKRGFKRVDLRPGEQPLA